MSLYHVPLFTPCSRQLLLAALCPNFQADMDGLVWRIEVNGEALRWLPGAVPSTPGKLLPMHSSLHFGVHWFRQFSQNAGKYFMWFENTVFLPPSCLIFLEIHSHINSIFGNTLKARHVFSRWHDMAMKMDCKPPQMWARKSALCWKRHYKRFFFNVVAQRQSTCAVACRRPISETMNWSNYYNELSSFLGSI